MAKLRFDITMTLDGYVAGPNQSEDNPLGEGAMGIHDWFFKLKTFKEVHGEDEAGETGINDEVAREATENIGATIMGRNMFGPIRGDWGDESWNGWWGEDPPYHVPVFVLTHHEREPVEMQGGTTFNFVTDGIESALEQARTAAGDKDVTIAGGAQAIQQYLKAGLVDEIELHVVPKLLGSGERLLDNVGDQLRFEPIRVIDTPDVTHLKYRVLK